MAERIHGRMKIRRINPMLKSLLLGIAIYGAIGSVIIIIFTDRVVWQLLGFLIGIILAMIMVVHMSFTIEESIYRGEKGALKHTRIMYIVRIVLVVVTFVLMIWLGFANPVSALFGLFSLKFSAYTKLITIKNKK